ncbi:response regulator transcription factor [Campylobacter sp. US33a]|uniref:Response regulator transcription factor n=1 Tax=Campylobacter sp. CCS1377 TaxID=3158229 RepID=A0AAU7E8G6_9BACT|nr:response regulator transcription factor [Campylobacter sp. US33a]MCW1359681.1 response regulator transcription factor [Campylobacter jejuni]TEY04499.1 response regulator transcription factor [Campylobacter sp. US33a]
MKTNFKKLSLLIVEDEESIRETLIDALKPYFLKILIAQNGNEGLKKFKKFKPNLVLSDISMPIMNGLDMAKEIKSISKEVPIVIMSAFSEKDRLLKAIDVGVDKYLIKPVDIKELLQIFTLLADSKIEPSSIVVISKHYRFDKIKKILLKDNQEINLTKKEFAFIDLLTEQPGVLVSHESIKKNIWADECVSNAAIRTFIKRIRDKTDDKFIKNIPGLGYKISLDNLG